MVLKKVSGTAQIIANTGYVDNFMAMICNTAWRFFSGPGTP
jgi:hypothetical protein